MRATKEKAKAIKGTTVDATVVRVVDGDTVRVEVQGKEESLRILGLDTEESNAGSPKPVSPWGKEAKKEAEKLFKAGDKVKLEFPGDEVVEECMQKYRGNYGRLLVFVYLDDGTDFQEYMIQKGFSPYFMKYGYAALLDNHERYMQAEKEAQIANRGVWNQIEVNGSEVRNYAALGVWWYLRAEIIQNYRQFKQENEDATVFNTRLDYEKVLELAKKEEEATIFTELRNPKRVASNSMLIGIGSVEKPFSIFIPKVDEAAGEKIMSLITNRYISTDEEHPRRSYAYVKGKLSIYRDKPQVIVTNVKQVMDLPQLD
ncbi:micrococcal nuclease-like nuclease [Rivularia sp. PCC 7116]|uniref:thermonuclease family protein n=1 Tax=Rivularia sp. PCC 7116 TaxID=373994 RepID=UPI00029F4783|nr:thermonuclease family protein [Rivularia sp. PCC 7116]AFY57459.1 micrococcal nuclease-like nuclease [Rivularia sp. PCC 7116]